MFTDFTATDRWTKKQVHCLYQALIVAIATRHADAVDIKFLVDGRPVWVALPHPAWVEYKNRTGRLITDSLAKEIAGHFLKTALESGEGVGREIYSLTIDETLKHLEGVVADVEPSVAAIPLASGRSCFSLLSGGPVSVLKSKACSPANSAWNISMKGSFTLVR
jgi:hypothetical protein